MIYAQLVRPACRCGKCYYLLRELVGAYLDVAGGYSAHVGADVVEGHAARPDGVFVFIRVDAWNIQGLQLFLNRRGGYYRAEKNKGGGTNGNVQSHQ